MNSIEQRPLTPWRTASGVIVGGAYIRPPKPMSADAEQLQAALLRRPTPMDRFERTLDWINARTWRVLFLIAGAGLVLRLLKGIAS
jgi:hypothetical protein